MPSSLAPAGPDVPLILLAIAAAVIGGLLLLAVWSSKH